MPNYTINQNLSTSPAVTPTLAELHEMAAVTINNPTAGTGDAAYVSPGNFGDKNQPGAYTTTDANGNTTVKTTSAPDANGVFTLEELQQQAQAVKDSKTGNEEIQPDNVPGLLKKYRLQIIGGLLLTIIIIISIYSRK